jgi:hypothetical protein
MVTTASAKAKGRKFQQKIAEALTKAFKLEDGDIESRSMGAGGEDLMLSPAARRKLPFSFECKKHKRFGVYSHYEQAKANAGKHTPVLVIEADREKPLVVLSFDDFTRLVSK